MADGSISFADGLGMKAMDSQEVRRKQRGFNTSPPKGTCISPNMNSASRNPKSSNIPNPKLSSKHTVSPTSLPVPFDLCPSLADVQSSSPNPNFSKSLSNFGGHSPRHSIHSTPTRKLQQVFQQESEMVESEERIT